MSEPDWLRTNRATWDERVPIHLAAPSYDLGPLRRGEGRLHPIEESELGPVEGLEILHLQCHFGRDSLILAQKGARVTALDFSAPAISLARQLAEELGLAGQAFFVEANLYDARTAIGRPAAFDRVFVSWGAICWLPDIREWARIVSHFLKPGGALYLAEGHPVMQVLDYKAPTADGLLDFLTPYFDTRGIVEDDPSDYADPDARIVNSRSYFWIHPLGEIVSALTEAGLAIEWLHEHDTIPWRGFPCLVEDADGMFHWPDRRWLPLAVSLSARRR